MLALLHAWYTHTCMCIYIYAYVSMMALLRAQNIRRALFVKGSCSRNNRGDSDFGLSREKWGFVSCLLKGVPRYLDCSWFAMMFWSVSMLFLSRTRRTVEHDQTSGFILFCYCELDELLCIRLEASSLIPTVIIAFIKSCLTTPLYYELMGWRNNRFENILEGGKRELISIVHSKL